ncbi:MAG: hypothetical protein ACLFR0_06415, partial [Alphaproteobacteria bacterium]
ELVLALACLAILFTGYGLWRRKSGTWLRALCLGLFLLAILSPSVHEENRTPVQDVIAVVLDQSPSQSFGERAARSADALSYLESALSGRDDIDLRIIKAPEKGGLINETALFKQLDYALADVPERRRAGVVFLSDGQIHDIPDESEQLDNYGPVHLLLSGDKNERDRQLVIMEAPSYGIVGKSVTVRYKIKDTDNIPATAALVTITNTEGQSERFSVTTDKELVLDIPIQHAGQNVFELQVSSVSNEITVANNKSTLLINGVRERLRVLLVSGQPHAGGRTWRDLLTSDPSVDLVHFTILREPSKLDATPQDELSLIAFPFRELFEVKLYDFDLIVFDRYRLNRILPDFYFRNIAKYVREGGAFLEASGPSFAAEDSIYFTALMDILPGTPTGEILKKPFRPALSDIGKQHPVTGSLIWKGMSAGNTEPQWGPWLRQVAIEKNSGDILLTGANENPLLILDRVEEGRVAQIASDHIWLWSRGYQEGGPHTELLRRIVHWLMKEPELDERALNIAVSGNTITLKSRDFSDKNSSVLMTAPDGTQSEIELERKQSGQLEKQITVQDIGIYSFEDAYGEARYAVVGDLNPPELSGVITTADKMRPLVNASGGGALWLADTARPDLRFLSENRSTFSGTNWIGFRQNNEYSVQGLRQREIMPEWLTLLLLLGAAILTWWIEGRRA